MDETETNADETESIATVVPAKRIDVIDYLSSPATKELEREASQAKHDLAVATNDMIDRVQAHGPTAAFLSTVGKVARGIDFLDELQDSISSGPLAEVATEKLPVLAEISAAITLLRSGFDKLDDALSKAFRVPHVDVPPAPTEP